MRWQAVIAVLAVGLILLVVGRTAFHMTAVVVPDYGGTYVEGVAGSPRCINPLLSTYNDVDRDLAALVFNGLTVANASGEIMPDLADTWDVSPDGLSYTFHLRRDVRWHDGHAFTADDVVFTIDLLRSPDFPGPPEAAKLWRVVQMERTDSYTVRFTLSEPFAPFLSYTTLGLLPAHILKDVPVKVLAEHAFNLNPVGTGPFKVGEVTAQHVLLLANTGYYQGRPYLDQLEFVFYPDAASVVSAYQRGEVLGAHVPAEFVAQVRAMDDSQLYSAPLSAYGLVFLNLESAVFQEKAVRQALMWATDRQKIIDGVLQGQAILSQGPILPSSWAYEEHTAQYGYDPTKARALLSAAGWMDRDGDGVREKGDLKLEFALLTNEDPTRTEIINELARQWAQVGVRAVPQSAGVAGVVRDLLAPRSYDAIFYEFQRLPADPDPYPQWHGTQRVPGGQNFSGYDSEQANLIMEAARFATNTQERAALYRDLQRVLAEDVPALPLYYPVYAYAVAERVHDVQIAPLQDGPDRFRTVIQWYITTRRVILSEARLAPINAPASQATR